VEIRREYVFSVHSIGMNSSLKGTRFFLFFNSACMNSFIITQIPRKGELGYKVDSTQMNASSTNCIRYNPQLMRNPDGVELLSKDIVVACAQSGSATKTESGSTDANIVPRVSASSMLVTLRDDINRLKAFRARGHRSSIQKIRSNTRSFWERLKETELLLLQSGAKIQSMLKLMKSTESELT
jgi:hypothetical protein